MMVKFPWEICQKAVGKKHNAVCCDLCNEWIHIACNNLDKKTYKLLQGSSTKWFCINCTEKEFPFTSQTNQELEKIYSGKHVIPYKVSEIESFTAKINNRVRDENNEGFIKSLYYDINELNDKLNESQSIFKKTFSLMHLNISSLQYHLDELSDLIDKSEAKFSVIGITESCLKKDIAPLNNINLHNYNIQHTPTESNKGGSLLYISTDLSYKTRNDLKMYKSNELESVFIEIISKKGKNTIVGCIYKHPKLAIDEFNNQFLSPMLEKVSFENKEVYLMGDFNINLLNYESNQETADFLNNMHSNSLVPYITLPTRITPRSKTLIDNIFFNEINEAALSGNLVTDISDHHAQFLITPKILENNPNKVTLRRSYKNFNNELFKNDLLKTDWESLLKTNLNDVNFSFEQFLLKLNNLLDIHAPFKYSKRKNEKHNKPWIANGIANSIRKKNNLYKKLCRAKDPER